jgi:hypothetical protein
VLEIYTYIHIYSFMHTHTFMHAHIRANKCISFIHTYTNTNTCIYIHMHMNIMGGACGAHGGGEGCIQHFSWET